MTDNLVRSSHDHGSEQEPQANSAEITKNQKLNNPHEERNRHLLAEAGVLAVGINGGPGCGKSTLVRATIQQLKNDLRVGVITCDKTLCDDAERARIGCGQIEHVATGTQASLDAEQVNQALQRLNLDQLDLLLIENVGTLVHSRPLHFGQDATAAVFSVAGGHDKAAKHPDVVAAADVIVLNKSDLLQAVPFDVTAFRADVRKINPHAELIELSSLHGHGLANWLNWLRGRVKKHVVTVTEEDSSHWFG